MEREQPPGQNQAAETPEISSQDEDTVKLAAIRIPGRPSPRRPTPRAGMGAGSRSDARKLQAPLLAPLNHPKAAGAETEQGREERARQIAQEETRELPLPPAPAEKAPQLAEVETAKLPAAVTAPTLPLPRLASMAERAVAALALLPTRQLPALRAVSKGEAERALRLSRGQAFSLLLLLLILVINATTNSLAQLLGPQGWAFMLWGPTAGSKNVLQQIRSTLPSATPSAHATEQSSQQLTPEAYINLILRTMTLDQKLGQMLFVQFTGPYYSLDLSTMVTQENVGAVILFTANNNIISAPQLKQLTQEIQNGARTAGSGIPLLIAIDQEGGIVDRLRGLDGPRPSAAEIGATNDPERARAAGLQDAHDLAAYGINLNLAPVVDVTSVYNPQLDTRTFGSNPTTVTRMAGAYLQGLQQSGQVFGTLKHFPGLGDVSVDPHSGLPVLTRSLAQLQAIDWQPYRTLIQQGQVHAIMVTHEIVKAVDSSTPSSLSPKVISGILRQQLGFQGVVITDSLTMEGVSALYDESQAAVMAVQAGADLLMGAISAQTAGAMLKALKSAVEEGTLSVQRIDESVRRILMLKYQLGLLHLPQ
ncbi:glycoside hydrolase family 3 protein [Thermogemmatispora carboxidivorans]|uniref:glycoside hydrolase family 3 protein n=1 Tax=Thermogemmatispora carboxidivorans TaxID=1382306 RepID=UPI00069A9AB8|nr:glycoside hydrolase family 3 N-terminal domain-containing protein [Thermogemmatispora carboxidivorans]